MQNCTSRVFSTDPIISLNKVIFQELYASQAGFHRHLIYFINLIFEPDLDYYLAMLYYLASKRI